MTLLDLQAAEKNSVSALQNFLPESLSLGLDVVTRQFLLFAAAAEAQARTVPLDDAMLQQLAAASETVMPHGLLPLLSGGAGEVPAVIQLLADCCPVATAPVSGLSGYLVSLEGGDGSGKTTQAAELARALAAAGYPAVATRALGATPNALALRQFILDPDLSWTPLAEALLSMSIYRETFAQVAIPALAAGQVVVSDRLLDTALVYFRHDAAGVTPAVLRQIYAVLVQDIAPGLLPHRTFLLDLTYEEAMSRRDIRTQGRLDRNEGKGEAFHRGVLERYRQLAASEAARITLVPALQPAAAITQQLFDIVTGELG